MKSMLAIGECMMEIIESSPSLLKRSFAGDTYNALVYAKRYAAEKVDCQYFTAVGDDAISESMLASWQVLGISDQAVLRAPNATIGIYAIATDDSGERRFSYWRNQSAATKMMQLLLPSELEQQSNQYDLVFFSGISIGILSDTDKPKLMAYIQYLRSKGARIAFDPNYRPAMWQNKAHAIEWINIAYQNSDIILPGIDEHKHLFGHQDPQDIVSFCDPLAQKEVVVKCAEAGTFVYVNGQLMAEQPFIAAAKQVDSTAAGDSFAGTYLSARLCHNNIQAALQDACEVARLVVQHQGAILPIEIYAQVPLSVCLTSTETNNTLLLG